MYVVVQLCCGKSAGVKDYWIDFILFVNNRKDCSKSIVQSISFHNELSIRNPISEDGGRGEYFLIESIMIGRVKLPRNVLLGKACQ